jgi:hypothetical protein
MTPRCPGIGMIPIGCASKDLREARPGDPEPDDKPGREARPKLKYKSSQTALPKTSNKKQCSSINFNCALYPKLRTRHSVVPKKKVP